jgi:type II secretory pathway pseudopilin PulG
MSGTLDHLTADHQRYRRTSLVELLLVALIVGLLAAIAISGVVAARDDGEGSAAAADRRRVQTAEEAYRGSRGSADAAYVGESDLVRAGFLGGLSTIHDVCLADGDEPSRDGYAVVPAGDPCPRGMTLAP